MGEDKMSWDDFPSLEGLKIDWDYEPENPLGKRAHIRLTKEDLSRLLEEKKDIPVKLATKSSQFTAYLVDISQGGVCLRTKSLDLQESELAKIGFFLGTKKLISRGRVKYIHKEKDYIIFGLEFVGLSGDDNDYIAGLYSSIKL